MKPGTIITFSNTKFWTTDIWLHAKAGENTCVMTINEFDHYLGLILSSPVDVKMIEKDGKCKFSMVLVLVNNIVGYVLADHVTTDRTF